MVIVPRLPALERLCAETALRAQRQLFATLSANLTDNQRRQLDTVLELREDRQLSVLACLRSPSGIPSPRTILTHIERLQRIREIELSPELGQRIHQNRLLQLARESAATTTQHLARFDDERRYGCLVAVLLETMATLTDEILDLHDRFIGSLFNKAKRKHDDAFQASGKASNEKVRLYARIGQVLLAAKRDRDDPFAAIEQILPWEDFAQSVSEAETLARPEDFDFLGLITGGYSQVHRYAPTLLETFDFRSAPVVTPLMDAIETLRAMNRDKVRTVPGSANTEFVSRRWAMRLTSGFIYWSLGFPPSSFHDPGISSNDNRPRIDPAEAPFQQLQPGCAGVFHRRRSKVAPYEGDLRETLSPGLKSPG